MKQNLIVLLLISAFLAACAPATPPAPTPDINATVNAMLSTGVAATLTAQPTNTPLPTETPLPTNTPEPIVSDTPTPTTPTITPIPATTATSVPYVGCFAPAGTDGISQGIFRFESNTKASAEVYLHGVSLNGNKVVDCSYTVTASFNTQIIFGDYDYIVVVGNKTMTGSFNILSDDKTTMRIFDKKVVVVGP